MFAKVCPEMNLLFSTCFQKKDKLSTSLPRQPFTEQETEASAERLYEFVWQQTESGVFKAAA
jgi:hypothetical protein